MRKNRYVFLALLAWTATPLFAACAGSGHTGATALPAVPTAGVKAGRGRSPKSWGWDGHYLYVINNGGQNVVYQFDGTRWGDAAPIARLGGPDTGLVFPTALGFDGSANLYVAQARGGLPADPVLVFAPVPDGDVAPVARFGDRSAIVYPGSIDVDDWGVAYVADAYYARGGSYDARVTTWAAGSSGPVGPSSVSDGPFMSRVNALSYYPTLKGYLVALARGTLGDALEFWPRDAVTGTNPICIITGPHTGLSLPFDITHADDQTAYVLDTDPVTLESWITVYKFNGCGDRAPIRTLRGPATNLNGAKHIAVDNRYLYVTQQVASKGRILVFDAYANGDVPPLGSIEGPSTGLDSMVGAIAVGP